jgi:hypothetical protein
VEVSAGGSFGEVLTAAAAAGLVIRDLETHRTTLEDVFVRLLAAGHGGDAGARAAGPGAAGGTHP